MPVISSLIASNVKVWKKAYVKMTGKFLLKGENNRFYRIITDCCNSLKAYAYFYLKF